MVFIIIYAARANAFVRGLGDMLTLGNTLAVFFTLIMIVKHRVRFSKKFAISVFVLIFYTIVTFIWHFYLSFGFIPRYFIYMAIAYVICQIYGKRLYSVIESALLPLFVFSIIIWCFHLLFPSFIFSLVETFSLPTFSENPNYITYNCIFYTINGEEDRALGTTYLLTRNAGFAWEPGAYSCFACLAISCNLICHQNKLKSVPIVIYLIAIATSQSTTGIFILAAILLVWVVASKRILWLLIFIPLAFYIYNLPFVGDKFTEEVVDVSSAENLNAVEYHGRLFGFMASWEEFLKHPIIGIGGMRKTYLELSGLDATIFSGIGFLLTRFGLILSAAYFILLFKSEKIVRTFYNNYGGFYIIVVVSISMISYSIWEQPLFLSLAFMSIYAPYSYSVTTQPFKHGSQGEQQLHTPKGSSFQ